MAFSISASVNHKTGFTLVETNANESLSLVDSNNLSMSYSYGSGTNQITNAVSITGILPSGSGIRLDLQALPQNTFGSTQNINFTGIKNFTVFNTSIVENYSFSIACTGANACTNLFNGGSGNILVKPYSLFTANDPYTGFAVSASQRYVYLNSSVSGVSYKLLVLGLS